MERTNKFKYYVIQFLQLPYQDIDEYVCVPWTWVVLLHRRKDQKVLVSYPVENPSETAKRAKRRQKCSNDWYLYLADVKYRTDVYEDAKIFINGKMNDVYYEYKCSNLKNGDKKISAPVKRKTRGPKQNSKSNHEIDKALDLVVTSKNDDKSETKRLKRTTLPTSDTETAPERSKVVETTESVSDAAQQTGQASKCLSENQSSPTRDDSPIQNSCSTDSVEESDDRSCVEEIEHAENRKQERPSVIQNFSNLTNSLSNPKPMLDPAFFTDLITVLRNLHTVSANSYTLLNNLSRIIIDNTEAMKNVKQLIIDSRSSNSDILTTSPSTYSSAEVEKISEKNQSKQKQRDEESDDHGDDDTEKVPKKRSFQKRKFVLPPEYDEKDSRWTLKYRELAPGLVELMPHTNVYVNSIRLKHCKRLSKECKSLARMLLVEIFTKNALTVCSLTGSRAKAYDVEGAAVRPGLDENARKVLLTYVEEYGRRKGWITLETQSIQNSLRNKMQDFRLKYG